MHLYTHCNCLLVCGLFDSIIWALRLREAPVYLNFSPLTLPLHSDLLSCHLLIVLLNNHSPAPLLLPRSIPLFFPAITVYRTRQPARLLFHHIVNLTSVCSSVSPSTSTAFSSFSPDFSFLPFCPSTEAPLQLIITGWGRNFIMTSEHPTHFLSCALIIKGTSWAR